MAKKKKSCKDCVFYCNDNCIKSSNLGIKVRYGVQTGYFISKPDVINKNGDCKNWQD